MVERAQRSRAGEAAGGVGSPVPEYAAFASVYDSFAAHVPYHAWAAYLFAHAERTLNGRPEAILDLACGTGSLLAEFRGRVGVLFGLDRSTAMLSLAEQRLPGARCKVGRLQGPLPYRSEQFAWSVCTHDSLNYVLTDKQLLAHFVEVHRVLRPGGLYSVDAVTHDNIARNHSGGPSRRRYGSRTLKVERQFDPRAAILESRISVDEGDGAGSSIEVHRQRCYDPEQIVASAESAGLRLLALEGDYQQRPLRRNDAHMNLHFLRPPG